MPKVRFSFAVHNHQPVGNFDFVCSGRSVLQILSSLPFMQLLEQRPKIKITLHYTGILFHFFEKHYPGFSVYEEGRLDRDIITVIPEGVKGVIGNPVLKPDPR